MTFRRPTGKITAIYPYCNERGTRLFEVRRHDPKGFTVRGANGSWLGAQDRHPRVLYRLPELLATNVDQTVYVVEGEKDVDRLRAEGLTATCNPFGGGKGKWTRGYSRWLRGRHVVIIPDNDKTGMEHADFVARALRRVATSVKVLILDRLPAKGDVSDWLNLPGNTVTALETRAQSTPPWRPGKCMLPEPRLAHNWETDYSDLQTALCLRRLLYSLPLQPVEKLFLLIISDFRASLPQDQLAGYLGVSTRRARQIVASLRHRRHVQVTKIGRVNHYCLTGIQGT